MNPDPNQTPGEEPQIVDLNRLNEFADSDVESMRELVDLYVQQTTEKLQQLDAAIQEKSAKEVERLAHSCYGSSATCGFNCIAVHFRALEKAGRDGDLSDAAATHARASHELVRIRTFMEEHIRRLSGNPP